MMSYMTQAAAPSLVAHQQQQQRHHQQTTPSVSYQEWLKAWKSWAGTRKRGKMAQFIVQKLEENKQAKWLDITIGKFELTEWHRIAEEWFKEKPRNSDQVDAPCMLRKGLPRAFPGLDEVKGESIKEGTQYRSRVFQAPPALVQEVQLYVSKPMMYPTSAVGPDMSSYSGHMAMQMSSYPQTSNGPTGYNYVMAGGGGISPGTIRMKPDPDPILDVGGSPASSDQASPYTYSNYDGLHNGGGASMVAPPMITDSPVAASDVISAGNGYHSPYNRGQSPYSMESASPAHNPTTPYQQQQPQQMLQVPTSAGVGGVGEVDGWSNGSSHHNSPRYSPDPNYPQDMSQQPVSPPMMMPSQLSPGPGPTQQVLVEVKAYPDQSPLEGGGQLALLFNGTLPPGPKWLSFISQTRPEYVHQVEAIETNAIALTTIIPKHDIPETMNLQVVCGGQIIASTEFTYYANAQYHSDLLFQYLTHTFPTYFPDVGGGLGGMGGALGGDGGDGLGSGGYGGYYGGNIPSTSYSLLLGACRLGIEPLIYATLQLPSMVNINREQLTKAKELAEEHGHTNAAKVLGILAKMPTITMKGGEGSEVEPIMANEKCKEALNQLDNVKDNLKAGGQKILDYLSKVYKMEQRVKDEGERDSATSSPVRQPSSSAMERSDSTSSETRRRHSANRLQRQDNSVTEDEPPQTTGSVDELSPPTEIQSRASIAEQDDQLPPLRPTRSLRSRPGSQRKMLVASYSDAADSAVSMSFDHDLEQEMLRRGSASLVSSGLYSLNGSVSQPLISVTVHPQEGETLVNSLQYECVYQVTEDFPPNSDTSNVLIKSGDRIVQVGDHLVRDKGPEEFAELLRGEAVQGTTIKVIPQLSSSSTTSVHSFASSIGYSSFDVADRKQLLRRQSDREMASSLTTKVANLLSMKASIYPRSVTVPFVAGEGWGFELTGGSAVGIFISKVSNSRKELQVGDQVLELGGQTTMGGMSHYEATSILRSSKDKILLRVVENFAKFTAIKDQFEQESYYIRSNVDHTASDSKDMSLKKGGIVRVVNTVLFPGYWLAWSVDPNTGMDLDLRKIPSPSSAKQIHGKDIYEAVSAPQPQQAIVS